MCIFLCVGYPVWVSLPPLFFSGVFVPPCPVGLVGFSVRCLACCSRLSFLRARSLRFGWLCPCLSVFSMASFASFVPAPSSVSLGRSGVASSVVPVRGVGFVGGVVSASSWAAGAASSPSFLPSSAGASLFCVWVGSSPLPLVCLVSALSPADLASLVASVSSAGSSGVPVFPVVAAGVSGVSASGFFCGLASAAPGSLVAPAAGSFAS